MLRRHFGAADVHTDAAECCFAVAVVAYWFRGGEVDAAGYCCLR